MDNNELLQAIGQMIDTKLEPIIADIDELKQGQIKIETTLENVTNKNIALIAEGHKSLSDKLSRIDDMANDIEEIKGAIVAVEAIARHTI